MKFKNFMSDKMYSHSAKQYDHLNPTVVDKQFKNIDDGLNQRVPIRLSPRPPVGSEANKNGAEESEDEKPPTPRKSELIIDKLTYQDIYFMVRCNKIDQLARDVPLATMVLLKEKVDYDHAVSVMQQQRFVRRLKNVDGTELKKE